ncbi:hypothetical protein J2128_001060 [Methanomicrobium sp. W14]|uniref:hypothetical protein n=1 Tax=Methanomicrobium sp. W14 TaxID=2817839 RepID=UPI001AE3DC06|nr:hypothetical protein [Methanomicrobium sp. W14]MBP2133139.1 hypothetical protein [Methanomicrobium sp. W14]
MAFEIDQKLFKWIIAAIILMCLVSAAGILYKATDGFSFLGFGHSEDEYSQNLTSYSWSDNEDNSKPWGYKKFNWTYNNENVSIGVNIPKKLYTEYEYGIRGTEYPVNITDYITASEEILPEIKEEISDIIKSKGYSNEKDTTGLILSFVSSIPYETDSESGHSSDYPRTPAVILADYTGDSGDHSILAAAILREFGYGVSLIYFPSESFDEQTVIPEAVALGLISKDDSNNPVYPVSDKSNNETREVIPVWTVNVSEKGFPLPAYYAISPEVFPDDSLWDGSEYHPSAELMVDFTNDLKIHYETISPDSLGRNSFTSQNWQQETLDYYENTWYPSGITWSMNDKWRLYDKFLGINENPGVLYTPWGFAEANTTNPWRITFKINGMDELKSDKKMTPYSDVSFALYEVNSTTGDISLFRQFGWENHYGADLNKVEGPFSPGNYILGIFVRNAAPEVSVEYSGKETSTNYQGPI